MEQLTWAATPVVGAAFLASFVEAVEALTIVLAVGAFQGWRPALAGTFSGLFLLAVLILALGPLLGAIPIHVLQFIVGVLLLLFGMRWLRKAILRAAGVIALHDETAAYRSPHARTRRAATRGRRRADGRIASRAWFWSPPNRSQVPAMIAQAGRMPPLNCMH
jgi:hypothetical protein